MQTKNISLLMTLLSDRNGNFAETGHDSKFIACKLHFIISFDTEGSDL